jgi:hypothetical protein
VPAAPHLLTRCGRNAPGSAEQPLLGLLALAPVKQAKDAMPLGCSSLHIHPFLTGYLKPANGMARINTRNGGKADTFNLDS